MNKACFFLLFVFFSLFVFSVSFIFAEENVINGCPPNCDNTESFQIADMLTKTPSLVDKFKDEDIARAIDAEYRLMKNPVIFKYFDLRIKSDVELLNKHGNVRLEWFNHYKISADRGVKIKSYKEGFIETLGSQATKFELDKYPGAKLTEEGALILSTGQKIASGEIILEKDGSIRVNLNKGGVYQIDEIIVTPQKDSTLSVKITDKLNEVEGKFNIYNSGKDHIEISGKAILSSDNLDHLQIGEKTSFSKYSGDIKIYSFDTEKSVEYDFKKDISGLMRETSDLSKRKPSDPSSITEDSYGNLMILSNKDNKIDVELFKDKGGEQINNVKVLPIGDKSEVDIKSDKATVYFSKDFPKVVGNIEDFQGIGIVAETADSNNIVRTQKMSEVMENFEVGKMLAAAVSESGLEAVSGALLIQKLDKEKAVAVLVGVQKYNDPNFPELKGTLNDVKAMKEYLIANGFKPENILTLENPTKKEIISLLNEVKTNNPNSERIVYFSGHGYKPTPYSPSNTFNIAPKDFDLKDTFSSGIDLSTLYRNYAPTAVIADTCFSGCLQQQRYGPEGTETRPIIITSSEGNQLALETEDGANGRFTKYLTQGTIGPLINNQIKSLNVGKLSTKGGWKTAEDTSFAQNPTVSGFVISNVVEDPFSLIITNEYKNELSTYIYQK